MIFLIFVFIGREALPVIFGKTNTALLQKIIPVEKMDQLSPAELRDYLNLTETQYRELDRESIRALMEVRVEYVKDHSADPDAQINTTSWRHLLSPHRWAGYSKPEYIWQPVSEIPKYNIIPLIIGSLKVTLVALVFSVPLALGAAIYVSQLARPRVREIAKPVIEMLAGIPSVVLGFFALIVMASVLQQCFRL